MNMLNTYFEKIHEKLQIVMKHEQRGMEKVATKVAETIMNGGIIQLFGCGHSHILTEEVFYRAGGLAPIKPILIEPLMLHKGAVRSSQLERQNDYAQDFIEHQDIQAHDLVFVISTSGINPVPIDVAIHSRARGALVVGISSFKYVTSQPSRHKSGKYLSQVVDFALNNHSNTGDATITYGEFGVPFGPTSTVVGAAMLNGIFAEAIKHMINEGYEPPIFRSGNIDGADHYNKQLTKKYGKRIPLLKQDYNSK